MSPIDIYKRSRRSPRRIEAPKYDEIVMYSSARSICPNFHPSSPRASCNSVHRHWPAFVGERSVGFKGDSSWHNIVSRGGTYWTRSENLGAVWRQHLCRPRMCTNSSVLVRRRICDLLPHCTTMASIVACSGRRGLLWRPRRFALTRRSGFVAGLGWGCESCGRTRIYLGSSPTATPGIIPESRANPWNRLDTDLEAVHGRKTCAERESRSRLRREMVLLLLVEGKPDRGSAT